jgi:hypothetical protein
MSSLTNVNNNAAVVVVGRTAPISPGQQPSSRSLPVVLASDQSPVPVVEQNKIASEVALSLLGIPRSEVALGIFADVNTYDINPSEWSQKPAIRQDLEPNSDSLYAGFNGVQGWGLKHLPEESGALVEAPADKVSVLTSKRFFRYQPGRVSSSTFGVKTSIIPSEPTGVRNPCIRKYGSFDNFDGYYWETRDTGKGDQLVVVRRTTSLIKNNPLSFGLLVTQQTDDFGLIGEPPSSTNSTGTSGDLVVLRDGLVHVHAAMYDPSLLIEEKKSPFFGNVSNNTIPLTNIGRPEFYNGQLVIYENANGNAITPLINGGIYKIINKSPVTLGNYTVQLANIDNNTPIVIPSGSPIDNILKTPVPFIFPDNQTSNARDVMWPLQRNLSIDGGTLDTPVGLIDTTDVIKTKEAIELINNNVMWKDWVKWNVKPEFYHVYEFRVPRSRFSGDFLNGVQANPSTQTEAYPVLYSDLVRTGSGNNTIKRPGESVTDEGSGVDLRNDSIWNLDFNKVTMKKIEFSWYGAVGALFLAYIPVSNGEARWVRVHHMRASNQLKVASLGNPTLPITYLVYGGGSENRYGYLNSGRLANEYGDSYSQYIVKYGASYYIDGGDRGTVRLYSYSSPSEARVYGSKYRMRTSSITSGNDPSLTINETSPYNVNPSISDFYMGATVLTSDPVDQGIKVIWVDSANKKLHLNKSLNSLSGIVKLDVLVNRPQLIYGLETKTQIVSSQGRAVRNRVQVYPTRLSTGSNGNNTVSIQLLKNPIFQTFNLYNGTCILSDGSNNNILKPEGQPTLLTLSTSPTTLTTGMPVYGWFRAFFTDDPNVKKFTVLGLLNRVDSTNYTFTSKESYSREVKITGTFLHAKNYDDSGNDGTIITTQPTKIELERLSSVQVVNELRTPIPGTGTQITSFYISQGGEQFDLSSYFDYNKDYLSFPLTDEVDSLYIASTSIDRVFDINASDDPTGSKVLRSSVLASITWEEQ